MVLEGMQAPNFTLFDQNNQEVSLTQFLGKIVVFYFYPKDHTPGCTREACAFRDNYAKFKEKDVVVIGVSKDDVKSHAKFAKDYNLPFILLADPKCEVINAYGVWKEKVMFGKKTMGVRRSTFVIDENGKVIKVFPDASPDTNASEILEFLG